MKRVPTNLITGFLGAGKTTAIQSLLAQRPSGERWSVLVNEYGMVSLDHALLQQASDEIAVQEIAGGCFCCTTSLELGPALTGFLRQTRPDRLIIEPSGAGHPARVIDLLRSSTFCQQLDLRSTVCLVDPHDFDNPRVVNRAVFHDQIQMADVVVLNWLDKRPPELVERCRRWIDEFDPPKQWVAETQFGQLDPRWLDLDATRVRPSKFGPDDVHPLPATVHTPLPPAASAGAGARPGMSPSSLVRDHAIHDRTIQDVAPVVRLEITPLPGKPVRLPNQGQGQWACGWIFSHLDQFDRDDLWDFLGSIHPVVRLKGVFHCTDDWWQINRVSDETSFAFSSYRRDSRLEIIVQDGPLDWESVERQVLACRRESSSSL